MVTLLVIDSGFILIAALILYILGMLTAWKTQTNWLYAVSSILWFIPMFLIDNIFIIVFSIAMLIFGGVQAFVKE